MTEKYTSLNHASHNEEVCNTLHKHKEYKDWVITTAFYAAMHFMSHKLFPLNLEINNKKISVTSFENYCIAAGVMRGKHKEFSKLVDQHLPNLSSKYNHLKDISWTARYNQYQFEDAISALARQRLSQIKTACCG